jgi:endoglucanase
MTLYKKDGRAAAAALLLCGFAAFCFAAAPSDMPVRLNSIGFVPNYPKKATIMLESVDGVDEIVFYVKRASDNATVFEGSVPPPSSQSYATGEFLVTADFTAVTAPGSYYLDVPGVGRSAEFKIADDIFIETYRALMLGMYLWRCGAAVSASYNGVTYSHAACHLNDGTIYSNSRKKDGTGGWHDAGDYNKYVVNSGVTVGIMLKAWEHFRPAIEKTGLIAVTNSGTIPAYLAEVKWNLDWVSKMQFEDSTVSHKLSSQGFGSMNMMPENDVTTRYFTPYGTAATASFVAMMAQAYRIYGEFDPDRSFVRTWGNQMIRSYNYLANNPGYVPFDKTGFNTGDYQSNNSHDSDDRLWAAAEMWETLGQDRYLQDFETRAKQMNNVITQYFDWNDVANLGMITYLLSERQGRNPELVESIRANLISTANAIARDGLSDPHGRTFGAYYWGTNGVVARNVYLLYAAYKLTDDASYAYAAHDALSYLLGRNYYGRSYVTGVGHNPPVNPHDRTTVGSGKTWPGRLIGGPHTKQGHNDAPDKFKCDLAEVCWFDDPAEYWTNEVAINWNSAMIFALAAMLPNSGLRHDEPYVGVAGRQTARPQTAKSAGAKTARIARANGGRINIPYGAKVYSLDGKLIAERKNGAPMPLIRRNGVFIVRVNGK